MTSPAESLGPEKAPDIPELPEPQEEDPVPEPSAESAPGDPEQQGSPVLDDADQAMPGHAGEPSS
jgi:hypothetical protein